MRVEDDRAPSLARARVGLLHVEERARTRPALGLGR
jgi:hypothetical protein